MQLTSHTDYALRVLLILGTTHPEKKRTSEIASAFSISENHVAKVVQSLVRVGYVETSRGVGGGMRLARPAERISLGAVVRSLEPDMGVVPCLRDGGEECLITPACGLKHLLSRATEAFLSELDCVSLADALRPVDGRPALTQLLELRAPQLLERP